MAMTDISNPMAHQLPLHNHRGGLVQPSLVMNHHLDMDMECHGTDIRISKLDFDVQFYRIHNEKRQFRQLFRFWRSV